MYYHIKVYGNTIYLDISTPKLFTILDLKRAPIA